MDTSRQAQEAIAAKSEPAGQPAGRRPTTATLHCGEAADCGRDVSGGRVSGTHRASSRGEREPTVWLAPAVLERQTGGAEADDEVASRASE